MSSGYLASASFAQQQLYYLDLLQPGQSTYALPLVLEVRGPADPGCLGRAFNAVLARHDVLRAVLRLVDERPMLLVRDSMSIEVPLVEVEATCAASWRDRLGEGIGGLAARPFDLGQGPLVRASMLRPRDPAGVGCALALLVVFHHAVADGASMEVFMRDLAAAYAAEAAGEEPVWDELPLQYPDYADWEQERFAEGGDAALAEALAYWREQLRDAPAVQDLPLDRQRGVGPGQGATARLCLPGELAQAVEALARERGCTAFQAFMAIFYAVLQRWSGLEDLIVTVPVSKRTSGEVAGLVGLFVDTMPLRLRLEPGHCLQTLLCGLRAAFLDAIRHREVPFQKIVQAIGIERRAGSVPLMQILFGSLDLPAAPVQTACGVAFQLRDDGLEQTAKSDLSLVYRHGAAGLELWCRYDPALFDAATVDALLALYGLMARAAVRAPDQPIASLPLLDAEAAGMLLAHFNDTARPYPAESHIPAVFAAVVARHGDRVAVDESGRVTSYTELDALAGRLAAALAEQGVGAGAAVVLVVPMTTRFIAWLLAILRLGASYVPLDPSTPPAQRVRLARKVSAAAVILSDDANEDYGDCRVLRDETLARHAPTLAPAPVYESTPETTAYIMFTSGSTGEPKAVAVPQRGILRLVCNSDYYRYGPDTRAAVYSNPSFDASTMEIWGPLLNGGTAVLADRQTLLDVGALRRFLDRGAVNLLWITAGFFHEVAGLDPSVFAGERMVITGGDVVSPEAVRAVLEAGAGSGLRLINAYGPTENCTFSTCYPITEPPPAGAALPIGRPIANSRVYILDPQGRPLPIGLIGEIYVGGDGVAGGYVGAPELTASAFLPDPFDPRPGARMYRTGDFGRWRADGQVAFAGRRDGQVKVRGYRIELGEIASALRHHPALRDVYITAPRGSRGERQLIAYVVAKTLPAPLPAALRTFLEERLPPHMLPQAFVILDALPLNPSGKVDQRALPSPADASTLQPERTAAVVAPRSEEEAVLAALWCELLELERVSVTDNFFHVGGDSILAIRLAARAAEAGLSLSPSDIFQHPTVERMAAAVSHARPRPGRPTGNGAHAAELTPHALGAGARPFMLASLVFDQALSAMELGVAVQHLAERHDALRLRSFTDAGNELVEITAFVPRLPIRTIEAEGLIEQDLDAWVEAHAERIGRGLDIRAGTTVALTLVKRGARAGAVVVVAVHRAVADERGLALLAAELETVLKHGHGALAPAASASYAQWTDWLRAYVDAQAAGPGLERLESLARQRGVDILVAEPADATLPPVAERWLDAELANALSEQVPARLAVAPLDMLATAFARALAIVAAGQPLLFEAVDGGRCLPEEAPRVEGLAGNFEQVSILLAPTMGEDLAGHLRALKSSRQAVAAMAPAFRTLAHTFDLPQPQLGLAWSLVSGRRLRLHSLPTFGPAVRGILLAAPARGGLRLAWHGAEPAGGAVSLLERVAAELAAIVALAREAPTPLYTADDFPLASDQPEDLERVLGRTRDIVDIYPLSPMQEAMLVHSLAAAQSEINFEQACTRIRGRLDVEAFREAWETVLRRHDVLRTSFHWRGLRRPLQVVQREVALPLRQQVWEVADEARLQAFLAEDRAQGFTLETPPLLRLCLIQVATDEFWLVSSFHHLLVDGWCLSRLEREVRAVYESRHNQRPPLFDDPVPYRRYIAWLRQQDSAASERFFSELLSDLPARRRLFPVATQPARAFASTRLELGRASSKALAAFARRRGLTLATTLHFAWAVWLAGRLDCDDVVCGTTVSGRPADIAGVERIMGLFINNLPLRLRLPDTARIGDCLAETQVQLARLQEHAHLPPALVARAAAPDGAQPRIFDTLVVVENIASGSSAWAGAQGLQVEALHGRLKTAYDMTFVAVPGDRLTLSLIQPEDGRVLEDGDEVLRVIAAVLDALPTLADEALAALPRPAPRPVPECADSTTAQPASGAAIRPRSTLETQIAEAFAVVTRSVDGQSAGLDLEAEFWRLGATSLQLLQLAAELERRLEQAVPVSLLLEYPSIAALAGAIARGRRWSPVVVLNKPREAPGAVEPFVCVHPVAGDVGVFLDLARALPPTLPFWAIQAAGLEEGQVALDSVEALAVANLEALAERGLRAPRCLGGYSFGGLVAFEMARQLCARGEPPSLIVILDTPAPLAHVSILEPDTDRSHAIWLARMADVRARFQGVAPILTVEELQALPAAERFAFALERLRAARLVPPTADAAWLERAHRTSLIQYQAYLDYAPVRRPALPTPLVLIRAAQGRGEDLGTREREQLALRDMGWGNFADEVEVRRVEGDHVGMLSAVNAPTVAQAITEVLACYGGSVVEA